MNMPNLGGITAEQAEALFNLTNNGVLTRIDERGERAGARRRNLRQQEESRAKMMPGGGGDPSETSLDGMPGLLVFGELRKCQLQ